MDKLKAAVVGATGIAGQQFVSALANHPWFEVCALGGSERSAGKKYIDALSKASSLQWFADGPVPEQMRQMAVMDSSQLDASKFDVIFTAVESEVAKRIEPVYAQTTPVFSTASAFRYEPDVPLMISGVNLDHAALIEAQRKNRGWKGFVAPIPNCTTTGMAVSLAPLAKYGIDSVVLVSMQAVSGAGRSPGVLALDITDNVIPFIDGEEEKVIAETRKILGSVDVASGKIADAKIQVSASCNRVAVREGHTESVFAVLRDEPAVEEVANAWESFDPQLGVFSEPKPFITYHRDPYRPQPRLDRDTCNGLSTSVGRLRKPGKFYQWTVVSHNTKIGAAKGAVLLAECLKKKGYL
ncbi:MAG: aspartate-semialdehyde dehydrogenase [Candidatus Micrarchaeia archaeon]|jgi:aspartate-semialdehyde dehydrogenase